MSTGASGSDNAASALSCSARLDALLDFANGLEIFVQLGAIARAERFLKPGHFLEDGIENVAGLAHLREALRRRAASPNSRSNTMRGCGSIGSGVVGDFHEIVFEKKQSSDRSQSGSGSRGELERRQPRVFAEVPAAI